MAIKSVRELILRMKDEGVESTTVHLDELVDKTEKVSPAWAKAAKTAKWAGAGIVAAGVAVAGASTIAAAKIIGTGSELEQYRIQLNTVLRDTELAAEKLRFVREFAAQTPFEVSELIEATIRLEQFGLAAEDNLRIAGDTAGALGKDIMQVAEALADATTGEFERLKEFGINTAKIAKELGHEVRRDTEQDYKDNVDAILRIMDREFGGGMKAMSQSWIGIMSNMSDWLWNFQAEIAESGAFALVREDLRSILDMLNKFAEEGGIKAIAEGFGEAFELIHRTFFQPFFDDLDEFNLNTAEMADNTEAAFLRMSLAAADAWFWQDKYKKASIDLAQMQALQRGFTLDQQKTFEQSKEAYLEAIAVYEKRTAEMRARLNELSFGFVGPPRPRGLNQSAMEETEKVAKETAQEVAMIYNTEFERMMEVGVMEGQFVGPVLKGDELAQHYALQYGAFLDVQDDFILESELRNESWTQFQISNMELVANHTQRMYDQMLRYQMIFTKQGMNLGRAISAFLIRGAAEVAKSVIENRARQAKIDALSYAADALAALAMGDFRAAATFSLAAAKKGLIAGAAGIATALIEREAIEREEGILGQQEQFPPPELGRPTPIADVTARGAARTVRAAHQTNNFYINLVHNIDGDYIVTEEKTDAQLIQDMIDEGVVMVD